MNRDILKSVSGASIVLTLLSFLSKGIGFIREIIYASKFGISIQFDLFLLSFTIPNIINTASIYLCQHYFVPTFNLENNKSIEDGKQFFNKTFWLFTISGLFIALTLFILSEPIMQLFFIPDNSEYKSIAKNMFNLFLITIPINSGISVIMAYHQSKFNFILPAITLTILNIIVITILLFFSSFFDLYVLPFSFIFAYSISVIILIISVRNNFMYFSIRSIFSSVKKENITIVASLIFIEGFSLTYVLIDRLFISEISTGGISALNYAFVVFSLPISLFSIPLVTTLFSKFSKAPENILDDIKNAYGMIFYLMLPISFLFYFWGDLIFYSFYERGKFTADDTIMTFSILKFYAFGLVFLSTYHLLVKIFYSYKQYKYVLVISISAIIIKVFLSAVLVKQYYENGLALSTTFLYLFLMVIAIGSHIKKNKLLNITHFVKKIAYVIVNLTLSYSVSIILIEFINIGILKEKIISMIFFLFSFYLNSLILNISEIIVIKNTVLKFFNKF